MASDVSVKHSVSVVWLKRDLRLRDHQPLARAIGAGYPIILLYMVEPMLVRDRHYDIRHWRFIQQSIAAINRQLQAYCGFVTCCYGDGITLLDTIKQDFVIQGLYSHQEIGIYKTYQRDLKIKHWCNRQQIPWFETPYGAVSRGLSNRQQWQKHWYQVMTAPTVDPDLTQARWQSFRENHGISKYLFRPPHAWNKQPAQFQIGGEDRAWHMLKQFFQSRGKNYQQHISQPQASRQSCSRLSPYLAWGNLSLKQVYQYSKQQNKPGWRRTLRSFESRLHWHCHFIQKLESLHQIEFGPMNHGYHSYPYLQAPHAIQLIQAWKQAKTGIPLVDACMRCLHHTGYLNFRMRAMLVSFLSHHLNLDWRMAVHFLARQFLDFEPGIHYPQFQMQAGVTGINTLRIYNPVKQAQELDADAEFISKWLPALQKLPVNYRAVPWLVPPLEAAMYDFILGQDYPAPVVDVENAGREARERMWAYRKTPQVRRNNPALLQRLVVTGG